MDEKQLIIGGLYHFAKDKKVYECIGINTDKSKEQSTFTYDGAEYQFYNKDMYGIQLTEYWLVKLGAVEGNIPENSSGSFGEYIRTSLWGGITIEYARNGRQISPRKEVEFVHELQAFYRGRGIELERIT